MYDYLEKGKCRVKIVLEKLPTYKRFNPNVYSQSYGYSIFKMLESKKSSEEYHDHVDSFHFFTELKKFKITEEDIIKYCQEKNISDISLFIRYLSEKDIFCREKLEILFNKYFVVHVEKLEKNSDHLSNYINSLNDYNENCRFFYEHPDINIFDYLYYKIECNGKYYLYAARKKAKTKRKFFRELNKVLKQLPSFDTYDKSIEIDNNISFNDESYEIDSKDIDEYIDENLKYYNDVAFIDYLVNKLKNGNLCREVLEILLNKYADVDKNEIERLLILVPDLEKYNYYTRIKMKNNLAKHPISCLMIAIPSMYDLAFDFKDENDNIVKCISTSMIEDLTDDWSLTEKIRYGWIYEEGQYVTVDSYNANELNVRRAMQLGNRPKVVCTSEKKHEQTKTVLSEYESLGRISNLKIYHEDGPLYKYEMSKEDSENYISMYRQIFGEDIVEEVQKVIKLKYDESRYKNV